MLFVNVLQLSDSKTLSEDRSRQIDDLISMKNRLQIENSEANRTLTENESQLNALYKVKTQLTKQLQQAQENSKRSLPYFSGVGVNCKGRRRKNDMGVYDISSKVFIILEALLKVYIANNKTLMTSKDPE